MGVHLDSGDPAVLPARGARPAVRVASAACCGAAMGMALSGHAPRVPTFTALLICALWLALLAGPPAARRLFRAFPADRRAGCRRCRCFLRSNTRGRLSAGPAHPSPHPPGRTVPFSVHANIRFRCANSPALAAPLPPTHVNPYVGLTAPRWPCSRSCRRHPRGAWLAGACVGRDPDFALRATPLPTGCSTALSRWWRRRANRPLRSCWRSAASRRLRRWGFRACARLRPRWRWSSFWARRCTMRRTSTASIAPARILRCSRARPI